MRTTLQKLITDAQISERKLAHVCGINQSSLNRFLTGKTVSMEMGHVMALAHYFDLTVSQLIGETSLHPDRKIRAVTLAMEQMPEYKKDVLVAASHSIAEPQQQTGTNGSQC